MPVEAMPPHRSMSVTKERERERDRQRERQREGRVSHSNHSMTQNHPVKLPVRALM